jgi:23S rRNA pseudouridine2457 synthase
VLLVSQQILNVNTFSSWLFQNLYHAYICLMSSRYFYIYKPFNTLSQFSPEGEKSTLKDLKFDFPIDVYPVGRLDADSEGLLILTNDKKINHLLLNPVNHYKKTYWVQVDGEIDQDAIEKMSKGVGIKINGKIYHTLPCNIIKIDIPQLPERNPPIRYRKEIPTSWIAITLEEGKNRQVRKMTASVGYPTLRLIRSSIENLKIENIQPGEVVEISSKTLYNLLNIPADRSASKSIKFKR